MIVSMFGFAIEDMFIKAASSTLSISQILMQFGLGGMLVFIGLTWQRGERVLHPAVLSRPILIRAFFEVIGRFTFALAITLTALSSASAILQATPLVVVLGAAFFFGEHVGLKRWIAVLLGLLGVLLIIRPGLNSFHATSLFAVFATLGFAGRDLATRAAPKVLSSIQLGVYGFFVLIPPGLALFIINGDSLHFDTVANFQILCAIGFGTAAYYALTVAMRTGDVSVVTPFRYTRLLFALVFATIVFGERPDLLTLMASALIIVSGVYTLLQSRQTNTN